MLRIGLVSGMEQPARLLEHVSEIAVQIAAKPPLGPRGGKRVAQLQASAADAAAHQLSWALNNGSSLSAAGQSVRECCRQYSDRATAR